MGYTHILHTGTVPRHALLDWVNASNKIISYYNNKSRTTRAKRVVNCGSDEFNPRPDRVFANGYKDNGCETLYIAQDMGKVMSCKTIRHDYDSVVVAVMLYANVKFGMRMETDGEERDMIKGFNLFKSVFPDYEQRARSAITAITRKRN